VNWSASGVHPIGKTNLTLANAGAYIATKLLDSSIPIKNVNSNAKSFLRPTPALHVRALAFMLLLLVAYGATVEAAHTHGNARSINSAKQTTAFDDASHSQSTSSKSSTNGACLICQFHQQLSVGLSANLPHVPELLVQTAHTSSASISASTQANAPSRGRAPPSTSSL
jgi:hypothetical protein